MKTITNTVKLSLGQIAPLVELSVDKSKVRENRRQAALMSLKDWENQMRKVMENDFKSATK